MKKFDPYDIVDLPKLTQGDEYDGDKYAAAIYALTKAWIDYITKRNSEYEALIDSIIKKNSDEQTKE